MKKRLMALLLVLTMVVSMLPISAFAAEEEETLNYVSLGASNTNGYGLSGYLPEDTTVENKDTANVYGYQRMPVGSYPYLIASAINESLGGTVKEDYTGATSEEPFSKVHVDQLAMSSMRAEELRFLLDESYSGDMYTDWRFYDVNGDTVSQNWFGQADEDLDNLREKYREAIANADLITIDVGVNNFGVFMDRAKLDYNKYVDWNNIDPEAAAMYQQAKDYITGIVMENGVDLNQLPEFVVNMIDAFAYTLIGFCTSFDVIMEKIYELNPDVQVVVVDIQSLMTGLDAKMEGLDVTLPLGEIFAAVINAANIYTAIGSPYCDKYMYADVRQNGRVEFFVDDLLAYNGSHSDIRDPDIWDCFNIYGTEFYTRGVGDLETYVRLAVRQTIGSENAQVEEAALNIVYDALMQCLQEGVQEHTVDMAALSFKDTGKVEKALLQGMISFAQQALETLNTGKRLNLNEVYPDGFYETITAHCQQNLDLPNVSVSVVKTITLFGIRTGIGNSFFGHPTRNGHKQIADAILNSLENGTTGKDVIVDETINALEDLVAFIVEHYDELYAYGYQYAVESGYIAQANAAIDQAIAAVEALEVPGTDAFRAQAQVELNAIVATLNNVKAAINSASSVEALVAAGMQLSGELYIHLNNLEAMAGAAVADIDQFVVSPAIEAAQARLDELKAELAALKAELEAELESLANAIESENIAALEAKIAALQAEIAALQPEIEALQAEIASMMAAVEAQLVQFHAAIAQVNSTLRYYRDLAVRQALEALGNLVDFVVDNYDKIYAAGYEFAVQSGLIDKAVSVVDQAIAAVAALEVPGTPAFQAQAQDELKATIATLVEIKTILNNATTVDALISSVVELGNDLYIHLDNLESLLNIAINDIDSLIITPTIAEAEARLAELKIQLEMAAEELKAAIEAQIAELEAEIERLKAELQQAAEELKAEIEAQIAQLEAEVEQLKAQLEMAADELKAAIEAQIAALEAQIELLMAAAEAQLIQIQNTVALIKAVACAQIYGVTHNDLVVTEDSSYVSIAGSTTAYAQMLTQLLLLDESKFSQMSWNELDFAELAQADLITIGYGEQEMYSFAVSQLMGYVKNFADTDLREDVLAYARAVASRVIGENAEFFFEKIDEAVNAGLDGILADEALAGYTMQEMDWAAMIGDEYAEKVELVRAEISKALAKAEVPTTYTIPVDMTEFLLPVLVSNGISMAADELYDLLGEDAYFNLELPVVDFAAFAAESLVYSLASFNVKYANTILAIREVNPDAAVMVLGQFNPFTSLKITINETEIDLGAAYEAISSVSSIHSLVYALAMDNVAFVDIRGVETVYDQILASGMMEDTLENFLMTYLFDPTVAQASEAGNAAIAQKIQDALNVTCEHWDNNGDYICDRCGEALENPCADGHTWDAGKQISAPSCGVPGILTYTCTVCGAQRSESIPALSHRYVIDQAIAPTCTENGLSAGQHCAYCGHVSIAQKVIDALGHKWVDATYTAPKTCSVCGATEGKPLTPAGTVIVISDTLKAEAAEGSNIDAETVKEVLSTLIAALKNLKQPANNGIDANSAVIEAAKANIKDANGNVIVGDSYSTSLDITLLAVIVDLDGDNAVAFRVVYDVTPHLHALSKDGTVLGSCELNNFDSDVVFYLPVDKNIAAEIMELEHDGAFAGFLSVKTDENDNKYVEVLSKNFSEFSTEVHKHEYESVVTAPTCTEKGFTTHTCACGDSYADTEVAALGHTEVVDAAVAATCTEKGKTEGKHCSVCNAVLVAQETVAKLAHTEEIIPAVGATCTATGLTEGKKCSVCGEILVAQETVAKLAHTEEIIPAVEATCTAAGKTEGKKCSVCGEILVAQETVAAKGHSFGEWSVSKEATRKEAGEETRSCACGETETREIPALGGANVGVIVGASVGGVGILSVAVFFLLKKKKLF